MSKNTSVLVIVLIVLFVIVFYLLLTDLLQTSVSKRMYLSECELESCYWSCQVIAGPQENCGWTRSKSKFSFFGVVSRPTVGQNRRFM